MTVRARAFELLGGLLLGEPAAIDQARRISPFRELLGKREQDDVASEHYERFGLGVYPHAGVFTEDEAQIGGRIADRVSHVAAESQIRLPASNSPDHVGSILFLAGRLARHDKDAEAQDLINHCLLPWLAPWVAAARQGNSELWSLVVELSAELAADEAPSDLEAWPLAEPLRIEADVGVAAIASALTRPARVGAFLSVGDIRALGRRLELPTGFGSRRLMLGNLLRAAGDYDLVSPLLAAIAAWFRHRAADTMLPLPRNLGRPWAERAKSTSDRLEEMRVELNNAAAAVS